MMPAMMPPPIPPTPPLPPPARAELLSPVLIVEDEPLLQQRLRAVLHQLGYTDEALVFAATLAEAHARLAQLEVALALVDLVLPDGSGLTLIAQLRAQYPSLGILVVSAWSSEESILSALRAGATGYVLKERDDIEVCMSIRNVLRGGAPIDPFIARRILELLPLAHSTTQAEQAALAPEPVNTANAEAAKLEQALSVREHQILRLVADGLTNREIAEQLFLSRYTVESHIKHIYRKLAVSSRTMAVRTARAWGMLG